MQAWKKRNVKKKRKNERVKERRNSRKEEERKDAIPRSCAPEDTASVDPHTFKITGHIITETGHFMYGQVILTK